MHGVHFIAKIIEILFVYRYRQLAFQFEIAFRPISLGKGLDHIGPNRECTRDARHTKMLFGDTSTFDTCIYHS